jgi:hypothetical protein
VPTWVEVFAIFAVCHLVGDYLLQTEFQATNKKGGLGRSRVARRALFTHALTYTLAFAPALVWLAAERDALWVLALAGLVFVPHLVQDDGRLLLWYLQRVKGTGPVPPPAVLLAVDQSFHMLALFGVALLAVA